MSCDFISCMGCCTSPVTMMGNLRSGGEWRGCRRELSAWLGVDRDAKSLLHQKRVLSFSLCFGWSVNEGFDARRTGHEVLRACFLCRRLWRYAVLLNPRLFQRR